MDAKTEKTLERTRENIAVYQSIVQGLELVPGDMNHLYIPTIQNILRQANRTVECVETGEPFAANSFTNPAEIFTAMDLLGMDQFDKRYMSPDEVKAKISQFFSAMGLG